MRAPNCAVCEDREHSSLHCPRLRIPRLRRASEPLIGFRAWRVGRDARGPHLSGVAYPLPWLQGSPSIAVCGQHHEHVAPAPRCMCGLQGYYRLENAVAEGTTPRDQAQPTTAVGAVLGWGRAFLHHNGWRAQYASPLALTAIGKPRQGVIDLAGRLQLPLLSPAGLESYAQEFGSNPEARYRRKHVGSPVPPGPTTS